MITYPVALALILLAPEWPDSVTSEPIHDSMVLQASIVSNQSEKAVSAFGLKAPSVRLPIAVDSSGRTFDPIQPAVYYEENTSGDVLPSPQRVPVVPELKAIDPK
jgi:hypothetical protein